MGKASGVAPAPDVVPAGQGLNRAAGLIRGGSVVAVPTETLYGLAADACNPQAVEALLRVKGRGSWHPFPCLVADRAMLGRLVREVPPQAAALMRAHWPGPLTLVLPAARGLPAALVNQDGGVGVRVSPDAVVARLVRAAGTPLTATSANVSGQPAATQAADARLPGVSLVLDDGPRCGAPSTVVEVVPGRPLRVLRQGAVTLEV